MKRKNKKVSLIEIEIDSKGSFLITSPFIHGLFIDSSNISDCISRAAYLITMLYTDYSSFQMDFIADKICQNLGIDRAQ